MGAKRRKSKKQSSTSTPSEKQLKRTTFFLERSFGGRLVLEELHKAGQRWQNPVGPEAVQAFYGALEGRRANKGVFITTSSFTSGAVDFARLVEKIVLIDGARLTELMMEYGVGVSPRLVKIPKIDSDYFEE